MSTVGVLTHHFIVRKLLADHEQGQLRLHALGFLVALLRHLAGAHTLTVALHNTPPMVAPPPTPYTPPTVAPPPTPDTTSSAISKWW